MNRIRLLLIEDNRILRDGIVAMLRNHRDIEVVAASGNGVNSIVNVHELKPSIILLDLGLQNQNSLHLVELVKKQFPQARMITMNITPSQGDVLQLVKSGVSGFILRDATPDDFLIAIRSVANGETVLPPLLNGSLFSQIVEHGVNREKATLNNAVRTTKREQEIIHLISDGLSNKEIGVHLHISTYTVKSHIHNIMEKLALHKRLDVASHAATNGGALSREIAKNIPIVNN